ncbi:autotransporter assembly complex protein TamA [Roseovarius autotrophicus]|uniref:autotransporter assembly complex protein TamA n=1 Tax=Roseovarius autotrophicus TaxID=2824121 RepID=UPI001A05EA00|nr:BamA/TamA family outer membrane protein [Roseovarius autotrophicus]MBE0452326.1 BamA/TamA family outer membrane protein [Roseovarius sp.]
MRGILARSCLCAAVALGFATPPALAAQITLRTPEGASGFAKAMREGSLAVATVAQQDSTAQDLLAAAQADYARLLGVLYASGFYGGVISILVDGREAATIPPLDAPAEITRIEITVEPGPRFTFGRAEVAPLAPGTALPADFRTGETARGNLIGAAARAGVTGWRDAGHAKAAVAGQDIVADHARATLDAVIALAPGPRLRFGDLHIRRGRTPSRVREERIRAIAGLPTGKTFSPALLDKSANRLRRTGAFRSVRLTEAETPNPDGTLDIAARVSDAQPRRIGAGAELSSSEGVTLSGFWLHRNLLGGAERLRIDALIGGIGGDSGGEDFRLGARLDRPATFTPDTGSFVFANLEDNNEPDYSESKAEIGGGLTHIFSDTLSGEAALAFRYSEITDDLGTRTLSHILLPARLTWDQRDDPLNPTRGRYLDLSATPFVSPDKGSAGSRFFVDLRDYLTFGETRRVTLAGRAQLGSVAGGDFIDLPADTLFWSGGAGTVRGQGYQNLGVDLGPGITVGGRSFLGFSGEVRTMVTDIIQAVVFADAGFIGEEAAGNGRGEWHGGAGLGGRYFTAVGPIRVDLATPLDGDAGSQFEIYIGIGQAF